MKLKRKILAAITSLLIAASVILTGCATDTASTNGTTPTNTFSTETGILTLSVNPEIQIEYNREGQVTSLIGKNEDGKKIVESYQDYIGKDCDIVLEDLISKIYEAGYFVDDIDGNKRNVVLQLEPGSILPEADFLLHMSTSTQNAVKNLVLGSDIVTIDDNDYDQKYAKNGNPSQFITLEKAQEIALAQANVNAADAVFKDKEFDFDHGVAIFELEFFANGNEYDYDIDAMTGKVLKAEHEIIHVQNAQNNPNTSSATGNNSDGSNNSNSAASSGNSNNSNNNGYGNNSYGINNYNDTDYGPNNDGVTDYNDTDYGPNNDGVTDYNDTDYGPNNDGITDYNYTDYHNSNNNNNTNSNNGHTNYGKTDYGYTNYGNTNYGRTDYGYTNYRD